MARMLRELELLNYDATMARCSNSALKLVIWWGNNIGGGTMLISEAELKESVELAIAYGKKQIELCPNINDNNKEWCKEFVETMVKKELEKQNWAYNRWWSGSIEVINLLSFPLNKNLCTTKYKCIT